MKIEPTRCSPLYGGEHFFNAPALESTSLESTLQRSWRDEPRSTVGVVFDESARKPCLQGIPSRAKDRANLFCYWEPEENSEEENDNEEPLWGPRGSYVEFIGVDVQLTEVEVRFAFNSIEDAEDHAEVYVWQVSRWSLADSEALCVRDEYCAGEYVVEAGQLDRAMAMFEAIVLVAVERIRRQEF